MTNKTTEAYQDVFKFIEAQSFKVQPSLVMTDYEEALRNAIKNVWPNCDIRGCEFHYKQAINRRCRTDPILKELLKKSFSARKIKRMLMSIPLLPANKILEGYKIIQDFAKEKKMDRQFAELFLYFERQWLRKVKFTKNFCSHGDFLLFSFT